MFPDIGNDDPHFQVCLRVYSRETVDSESGNERGSLFLIMGHFCCRFHGHEGGQIIFQLN